MSTNPRSNELDLEDKNNVVVKIGMIGDGQAGKTSLMVKYIENRFDDDYIQTLGVNFMEKTISLKNLDITFSIWDLGGQKEYTHMLPLVCNGAIVLFFMFDLCREQSLLSVKQWYKKARTVNPTAMPFLVGCKFDSFLKMKPEFKENVLKKARLFAGKMRAPLIFCSSSHSVNIKKIFKIVVAKVFQLKCNVPEVSGEDQPIIEYKSNKHRARHATSDMAQPSPMQPTRKDKEGGSMETVSSGVEQLSVKSKRRKGRKGRRTAKESDAKSHAP
eukprot:177175_1